MPAKDTSCPRLAILIVAAQPLVAQDIALTIVDEMPDAQVIIAESIDAGMQAIAPFAAIAIATAFRPYGMVTTTEATKSAVARAL